MHGLHHHGLAKEEVTEAGTQGRSEGVPGEGVEVRGGVGEDTGEGGGVRGGAEGQGALEEGREGVAGLGIDQEIHGKGCDSLLDGRGC